MRSVTKTIALKPYSRRGSWPGRIVKSNWFAWALSFALHAIVFVGLYKIVFYQAAQSNRHIIPETRLAAGTDIKPPQKTVPLKLIKQPAAPQIDTNIPKPEEIPIAAVVPDSPPIELPGAIQDFDIPMSAAVSASTNQPVSSFFGATGNAYKVVYVVDVSASLMIYIDEIVNQMRKSTRSLVPTQRFHIVMAKPQKVVEFGPRRLVPALGKYKNQASAFIDSISGIPQPGKADPIEAMKRAFAVGPELIYFLTDGDYPDIQNELEQTLKKLNPDQAVKITTIGFDPSPNPRALLERIARDNGGNFRIVVLQ